MTAEGVSVTVSEGVVRVDGEVDTATAPTLAKALDAITGSLVLDLKGVRFMDSSGLRVLIRQRQQRQADGNDCELAAASAPVRRLLDIAGLAEFFEVGYARNTPAAAGD